MFVFAPVNHLTYGNCQSRTCCHGANQWRFCAISAQNSSGCSMVQRWRSSYVRNPFARMKAVMFAFSRSASDGSKSRSSCKTRFVVSNWRTMLSSLLAQPDPNDYKDMVARKAGRRGVGQYARASSLSDSPPSSAKEDGRAGGDRAGREGEEGLDAPSQGLCQDFICDAARMQISPWIDGNDLCHRGREGSDRDH